MLMLAYLCQRIRPAAGYTVDENLWQDEFYGDSETCTRLIPTLDGGFLLGGSTGYPYRKYFLSKTDADGELEWMRILSPSERHNYFGGVAQLPDSNYLIAGQSHHGVYANIFKVNSQGDSLLSRSYGDDVFNDIVSDSTGKAVAIGFTNDDAEFGAWDA